MITVMSDHRTTRHADDTPKTSTAATTTATPSAAPITMALTVAPMGGSVARPALAADTITGAC